MRSDPSRVDDLPGIVPFQFDVGSRIALKRHFTKDLPSHDPYHGIAWEKRAIEIKNEHGEVVYYHPGFFVTDKHSENAAKVIASKYAYGDPCNGGERGLADIINRVVGRIRKWGENDHYFRCREDAIIFEDELTRILITRRAAFNSPVWFNLGVEERNQQASACFINSVQDDMESILNLCKVEGMQFKGGSGAGCNVSPLRSRRETMTGGGKPSGPCSFMKGLDAQAGVIKSGGKTRRAAIMRVMDENHPDILDYIWCKEKEEGKAAALVKAGYNGGFEGEAWSTVAFQNANNSVRVSDETMRAVKSGTQHMVKLTARTTGEVLDEIEAKDLMDQIADAAWRCGDPGLHFDTIERFNKVPSLGKIVASNPCRRTTDHVLTRYGIRRLIDVKVGDEIWTGKSWAPISKMAITGVKEVYEYKTTGGIFSGTENHHVFQSGERIEIKDATHLDIVRGPEYQPTEGFDPHAIVDGLVLGDGTIHDDGTRVLLIIGRDDHDYFGSEIKDLIGECYDGALAYKISTSLQPCEVPHTYLRKIPDRFKYGAPNVVRSFLRGLYSANGSIVGGSRVTLKASSERVIRDVQIMLSSLGIRSYVTTNKENNVQFQNGNYKCKQSYDLNITTDRKIFQSLIGFIQKYKTEKLSLVCESVGQSVKPNKVAYEIMERTAIGTEPVMDITVDAPEHAYWSDGVLTSNCSEFVHVNDTSCNLASLNLREFQNEDGTLDIKGLCHAVEIMILAQEILVDNAYYPTARIRHLTRLTRPLGLGACNLGAYLMCAGLPYDSHAARDMAFGISTLITAVAYRMSARIARDCGGPFTVFTVPENKQKMISCLREYQEYAKSVLSGSGNEEVRAILTEAVENWHRALSAGERYGFRNDEVTCWAPTGTISFFMNADTTGCEPDIALVSVKRLAGGDTFRIVNGSVPTALKNLGYSPTQVRSICEYVIKTGTIEGSEIKPEDLPVFDCAFKPEKGTRFISWQGHVKMMGALQRGTSMAISKTVNLPNQATRQDMLDAYVEAWNRGVKALAVFRDGSKGVQVLTAMSEQAPPTEAQSRAPEKPTEKQEQATEVQGPVTNLPKKNRTMGGLRTKIEVGGTDGYVLTSHNEHGQLVEVFLTFTQHGSIVGGLMNVIAILISKDLQRGVPLTEITEGITHGAFSPSGWSMLEYSSGDHESIRARSLVDAVCKWLITEYPGGLRAGQVGGVRPGQIGTAQDPIQPQAPAPVQTSPTVAPAHGPLCSCGAIMTPNGPRCFACQECGNKTGGCG